MSRKALIVVDMLNDFVDEKGALFCGQTARDIIPFIRSRVEAYRKRVDPPFKRSLRDYPKQL